MEKVGLMVTLPNDNVGCEKETALSRRKVWLRFLRVQREALDGQPLLGDVNAVFKTGTGGDSVIWENSATQLDVMCVISEV